MSQRLLEFLKAEHPDVLESYKAKTDPHYFQVGKTYQPMRSGFGGSGKRYKSLELVDMNDRSFFLREKIVQQGRTTSSYVVRKTTAHIDLSKPLHY